MKPSTDGERDRPEAWAFLLAGGDGTRLQNLTRVVAGDSRPKQFCRLFGERSLLGHTRERLRPVFREERTMFVVTRGHETFYREELSDADVSRVVAQPANRGTGVAIAAALLRVLQSDPDAVADAVVAFFPSDHYIADDAAFAATVQRAVGLADERPESLILIGAEPQWPEAEYGWIEHGGPVTDGGRTPLLRVRRFWEKPPLAKARELLQAGGLWSTFITIGHAGAFLKLLCSTIPTAVAEIAGALVRDDLESAYREVGTIDFSKDVLSREPHRLLVIADAASGWADLGNAERVIETLVRNRIEPEWLREMRLSYVPAVHDSSPAPALHIVRRVDALSDVRKGQ